MNEFNECGIGKAFVMRQAVKQVLVGYAKTFALIGKAFAEANLKMLGQ